MTYPKLAVMADPKDAGRHPFHDNRWIVTEGTEVEWTFDGRDWRVKDGSLIAMMRDCQNQHELARLFASAPELLEALESCLPVIESKRDALASVAGLGDTVHDELHVQTCLLFEKMRSAIAKARGL